MDTSYTPVPYDFREVIDGEIAKATEGKIFFFADSHTVDDAVGAINQVEELKGEGVFIILNSGAKIRIDRIITLFGKPGAAYDEYDAFGNQCLACTGGYDIDRLP